MMKINQTNLKLLHSAISLFVGEAVTEIDHVNDVIVFITDKGTAGTMLANHEGNWEIWVNEEVVYEVEKELFEMLDFERDNSGGIIDFYNYIKDIDVSFFKFRSKKFFNSVKESTEKIILESDFPITGDTTIGAVQVHYSDMGRKTKMFLN